MILKMFSVFDSKAEFYKEPFYDFSTGNAIRGFSEVCSKPEHTMGKYPEDFSLWELGTFDTSTGKFEVFPLAVLLVKGGQVRINKLKEIN